MRGSQSVNMWPQVPIMLCHAIQHLLPMIVIGHVVQPFKRKFKTQWYFVTYSLPVKQATSPHRQTTPSPQIRLGF